MIIKQATRIMHIDTRENKPFTGHQDTLTSPEMCILSFEDNVENHIAPHIIADHFFKNILQYKASK
jgi:hypothetical protein